MKKINLADALSEKSILKVLLLMKLTIALVLISFMQVSANSFSQAKISLKLQSVELRKVFSQIEKRSDCRFLYNDDAISLINQKVNVFAVNAPVSEVLDKIFAGTSLKYKVLNDNLIVLSVGTKAIPDVRITGRVTGASGEPVPGATVRVKGGTAVQSADDNGQFSILAPDNAILVFSSIGFETIEVPLDGKTELNVSLKGSSQVLDQVIVVGYGTQRKSQVVGSVSRVKGEDISRLPVLSATQGLQGKTSGVQIVASGDPGTQPEVRIRGTNTITADANPIYVVDGVISADITNISNSDIESVEILKDAASQAIYGSRAANGVILITTKVGRGGKLRVSFDSYVGFKTYTSKVKMADATTYATFSNEARAYDNQVPMFKLDTLKYNTDWFKEISHDGMIQNHTINVSGGTDKTTYYLSAAFFKDEGILKGNDFTRGVIRNSNEYKLTPFLKFGHSLNLSITKKNLKPNEFDDAYRLGPTAPVKNPDGTYGYVNGLNVGNPVAALDYMNNFVNGVRLQGNVFVELKPIKSITLRSSMNYDRFDRDTTNYTPSYYVSSVQQKNISTLKIANGKGFYYIFDNNATYNSTFDKVHEVKLTVGYSSERNKSSNISGTVNGVPNQQNLWYLNQGDPTTAVNTNDGFLIRRASMYSRLTYTYNNKYNISGVVRRDGSSLLPVNQKWGTFYSVGGSWIISKEAFMEHQKIFDELKLRAGYGKIGNDNLPYNSSALTSVATLGYYGFGGNSTPVVQGITFNQIKDANVTWESTKGIDAGLEFTSLKNRLSGEIAYYNKVTNAYIPVPVAATAGDADGIFISQAADVRNKGLELNLNWSDRISPSFNYHFGFNITFNTNTVEKVRGGLQLKDGSLGNGEITTYTVENQPIGSFWVFQTDGIYKTAAEVSATPHITGAQAGDFKYADLNKDGVINDLDRIFVGSYQPKTYYGITTGFNWKELDFSIDCYGNAGNKVFNGKKAVRFGNDEIEAARANNRWSPTNPNGTQPRASNSIPRPSTYYVESGSFFRINNITLGYTIPTERWKAGITKLRFFASAQNPVIFKKYSGFTPELPGAATRAGLELGIYPVSSTYLCGVNLSF